jgi:hypothetical protein
MRAPEKPPRVRTDRARKGQFTPVFATPIGPSLGPFSAKQADFAMQRCRKAPKMCHGVSRCRISLASRRQRANSKRQFRGRIAREAGLLQDAVERTRNFLASIAPSATLGILLTRVEFACGFIARKS